MISSTLMNSSRQMITIIFALFLLALALQLVAAAPVNEADKKNRDVLIYLLN
jgi:hypothetical protein